MFAPGQDIELEHVVDTAEHYEACRAWLEEQRITRWLTSTLRLGRYLRVIHQQVTSDRRQRLYFIRTGADRVGLIGLKDIDRLDRRAETWYLIGSNQERGKGTATRAVGAIKSLAATQLGLRSLYAFLAESNEPSRKVLERNAFQLAGCFRNAFCLDGVWINLLIYDILLDATISGGRE